LPYPKVQLGFLNECVNEKSLLPSSHDLEALDRREEVKWRGMGFPFRNELATMASY